MTVAVIGATGFVGRHVLSALLKEGMRVKAISRNPLPLYEKFGARVETIPANILYWEEIARAIKGSSAVVNCAGIIREKGENTFEGVHIQGVINILHACRVAGVKRILHISALGAGRGIGTRYFRTKEMGEELIIKSGMQWTIFRPSVLIGEDGGIYEKVRNLSFLPVFVLPDMRRGLVQPLSVDDLSQAILLSLRENLGLKRIIEVGAVEMNMEELVIRILKRLGKKRLILRVPPELFLLFTGAMEKILNGFLPMGREELLMSLERMTCDPSEFAQIFKIKLRDPFEVGG